MILIDNKNAMRAYYYLMAADGEITADEVEKFDEIGRAIDTDNFASYREQLMSECGTELTDTSLDEYFDVVQEAMDRAIVPCIGTKGGSVSARLFVWNMLAVAFSSGDYSDSERRMIAHAVRVLGVDKTVFLEMEQLIKTAVAVEREVAWIKTTDKPYSEVQPIVMELEKRIKTILDSATALIDDEVEADEVFEVKDDFVDKTKAFVSDTAVETGEKTKKAFGFAKAKVSETAGKLFDGVKKNKNDTEKRGK